MAQGDRSGDGPRSKPARYNFAGAAYHRTAAGETRLEIPDGSLPQRGGAIRSGHSPGSRVLCRVAQAMEKGALVRYLARSVFFQQCEYYRHSYNWDPPR